MPWVLLESNRLVQRHVNALIISDFFERFNLRKQKMAQLAYGRFVNFIQPIGDFDKEFIKQIEDSTKKHLPDLSNIKTKNVAELFKQYLHKNNSNHVLKAQLDVLIGGTQLEKYQFNDLKIDIIQKLYNDKSNPLDESIAQIDSIRRDLTQANQRFRRLLNRQLMILENTSIVEWFIKNNIIQGMASHWM